jgi:hypothetical protein
MGRKLLEGYHLCIMCGIAPILNYYARCVPCAMKFKETIGEQMKNSTEKVGQ